MGLLQKLLGRRAEEPPEPESPAARADAESTDTASEPETAPRTSSVLDDAAPLPEAVEPEPSSHGGDNGSGSGGGDSGTQPTEAEPEPESEPVASDEEDIVETSVASVPAAQNSSNYFVPERPRYELLDLDPPEPPEEPPRPAEALPLDVAGSPRAALRSAGVSIPHMQQIVQRDGARLWAFGVRAEEALGWWLQVRQVHDKTGWLPVLLGAADDWLDNGESVLHEGDNELYRMNELNARSLLEDKAAEAGEPSRGVPILPTRGDSDFAVPKTDGLIGLVEAEHSWQIPALLPWKGSTNWELYGAEHATILKRWHEQHEVELVSLTWDILELYVPNPPSNDQDVLEVASEAYAYCPDLLQAGVPTLDDLAVHMIRSRAWYFRWN